MKTSTLVEIVIGVLVVAVSAYFLVKHFLHSSGPAPAPEPGPPTPPSGPTGATGPCPPSQVSLRGGGCGAACGKGYCEATSQTCVTISHPDTSRDSPLTQPQYSCSSESGLQDKYRNCVITYDDEGKAYVCSGKREELCYDTANLEFLPPQINNTAPLYNVTAWNDNLNTCGAAPVDDQPDRFCDYSTPVGGKWMSELFYAYAKDKAKNPSVKPVDETLDYFGQSSYKMRQSPLGYACLPVGSEGEGQRPQGYRYINFPLSKYYDKNTCTMVDCLNVALSQDVQYAYYDDDSGACMAAVCEGDECSFSMTPSSPSPSGPSQKLASRDADGPYCKKPTGGLDAFKTDNCPQGSTLDCLPDDDQDGEGKPDITKVYEQNGLQFWKPGQRNFYWCLKAGRDHEGHFDGRLMLDRAPVRAPQPLHSGDIQDEINIEPGDLTWSCSPSELGPARNALDYIDKYLYVDMDNQSQWCTNDDLYLRYGSLAETESPLLSLLPPSSDYGVKAMFSVTDWATGSASCWVDGKATVEGPSGNPS